MAKLTGAAGSPARAYEMDVAVKAIARADPVMKAFMKRAGPCEIRPGQGDYFAALTRSILYQQLAGKAAAAIHARFVTAIGGKVTPKAVLAVAPETLRGAGLSGAKTAAVRDLATKATDGTVPLKGMELYDDEEIISRLISVRGIGRWTAEMFLLFELRRPDVWPVDDLGVRHGYRLIYDLPEMLNPRDFRAEGDRFRPYRSVVAWYCWEAVHISRGEAIALPD